MSNLLEGRTPSGMHVLVTGDHPYRATVFINGERQPQLQVRYYRDGGSWEITTPLGTIRDSRNRLPRTEGRVPTLEGEPIE